MTDGTRKKRMARILMNNPSDYKSCFKCGALNVAEAWSCWRCGFSTFNCVDEDIKDYVLAYLNDEGLDFDDTGKYMYVDIGTR